MSDYSITVENLSKRYTIRHRNGSGDGLRHAIQDFVTAPWRGFREQRATSNGQRENPPSAIRHPQSSAEEFWALKDVSLEVKRGEVVGIIGRNGAGKSTLLKILSRITEPTEGRIRMRGRAASLLEVGTGFHPELTGRENIYLNGSVLGMTRAEINQKFDEIVAFAEIEKFLDTPVKWYSSGMYVRLAFAVAAQLDPEILLVDEVLAVGDAEFQKKCLSKMGDVARRERRTILFVSHNIMAIKQLCGTGVWLDNGRIAQFGPIDAVVQAYVHRVETDASADNFSSSVVKGDGQVELVSYRVTNSAGEMRPLPVTREDLLIHVILRAKTPIRQPACGVSIYNEFGVLMTSINTVEQGTVLPPLPVGDGTICIRISQVSFLPGTYTASFWVMNPQGHIHVMTENSIVFEIGQTPLYGTCTVDHRWGCVYSDVKFRIVAAGGAQANAGN